MATCSKYHSLVRGLGLIAMGVFPWDHFDPPELYNPSLTPNFEIHNNNYNFNRIETFRSRSLHFDNSIPDIQQLKDLCRP